MRAFLSTLTVLTQKYKTDPRARNYSTFVRISHFRAPGIAWVTTKIKSRDNFAPQKGNGYPGRHSPEMMIVWHNVVHYRVGHTT